MLCITWNSRWNQRKRYIIRVANMESNCNKRDVCEVGPVRIQEALAAESLECACSYRMQARWSLLTLYNTADCRTWFILEFHRSRNVYKMEHDDGK